MIFLSCIPAMKIFCLSGSGLNLTTFGTLPFVKAKMHLPVSVSHILICRSNEADRNLSPERLNETSLTACEWPMNVRRQLPSLYTSHSCGQCGQNELTHLDLRVHTGGEEQMTTAGEQADGRDALVVPVLRLATSTRRGVNEPKYVYTAPGRMRLVGWLRRPG